MSDEKLPTFAVNKPLVPPPPGSEPLDVPCHLCVRRNVSPSLSYSRNATLADLRAVLDALTPEQVTALVAEHPIAKMWEARARNASAAAESAERERDELAEKLRAAEAGWDEARRLLEAAPTDEPHAACVAASLSECARICEHSDVQSDYIQALRECAAEWRAKGARK